MTDILAVASEIYPLVKTGGLADVVGALPKFLASCGMRTRTVMPGYPAVLAAFEGDVILPLPKWFGGPAELLKGHAAELDLYVLRAPHLYERDGGLYSDKQGRDYSDNALRFGALCRVAADLARGADPDFQPEVVHLHDWQAGLTAAYLHYGATPRPGVVCTIHNLAFQGQFEPSLLESLGLPAEAFGIEGVEYYGTIGFLKAGLRFADRITTVSPSYAAEICTTQGGMGLEGLLKARANQLSGIVNGIDTDVWNPATDPFITAPFSADNLDARAANKSALQQRLGLDPMPGAPLLGVITRLSWQKGIDLLLPALPRLLADGAQFAVLGSGDPDLESELLKAATSHPRQMSCSLGYDETLAHQIQAGSDIILVPSRYEPCGLTQLCALRYGAVPLVARVGGLADTVIDANAMALDMGAATGIQFAPVEAAPFEMALGRALALYRSGGPWRVVQKTGMACDVSWRRSAQAYAALFTELVAARGSAP